MQWVLCWEPLKSIKWVVILCQSLTKLGETSGVKMDVLLRASTAISLLSLSLLQAGPKCRSQAGKYKGKYKERTFNYHINFRWVSISALNSEINGDQRGKPLFLWIILKQHFGCFGINHHYLLTKGPKLNFHSFLDFPWEFLTSFLFLYTIDLFH